MITKKLSNFLRIAGILKSERDMLPQVIAQPTETKILVLSPHPDDDVIGCGGTLCKYLMNNAEMKIVYVTKGGLADPNVPPQEMAEMRKKEARESIAILGGNEKDLMFLDYPDRSLKCDKESVDRFLGILDEYQPQAVYVPFFIDNHRDHITTAIILASALRHYPCNISCYGYEVWTPLFPNLLVDVTSVIDKKMETIKAHKSQINIIDYPEKIKGLNAYRSITAGKAMEYCEAFYKCSKQEYIAIAKEMKFI